MTVVHRATVNWPGDRPKTQYRKPGTYGKGRITPSLAVDETATTAQIDAAYRTLAKEKHPDTGGSHEAMAELNVAYEQAKLARGNNG